MFQQMYTNLTIVSGANQSAFVTWQSSCFVPVTFDNTFSAQPDGSLTCRKALTRSIFISRLNIKYIRTKLYAIIVRHSAMFSRLFFLPFLQNEYTVVPCHLLGYSTTSTTIAHFAAYLFSLPILEVKKCVTISLSIDLD